MIKRILIIPARQGSKSIRNKNIKSFLGLPIIAYSIISGKKSNLFRKISQKNYRYIPTVKNFERAQLHQYFYFLSKFKIFFCC